MGEYIDIRFTYLEDIEFGLLNLVFVFDDYV